MAQNFHVRLLCNEVRERLISITPVGDCLLRCSFVMLNKVREQMFDRPTLVNKLFCSFVFDKGIRVKACFLLQGFIGCLCINNQAGNHLEIGVPSIVNWLN